MEGIKEAYVDKAKTSENDYNLELCRKILETADEIYRLGGGDIRFVPEEVQSNGKD